MANDIETIRAIIDRYAESVNNMDLELGRKLWLDAPDVSFIHPRGHETGVENILQQFYIDTMGRFSKRSLNPRNIEISFYGDTAVAVFYWDFYATLVDDGSERETHGRETQVFIRDNTNTWMLVHIHYSGMPADD